MGIGIEGARTRWPPCTISTGVQRMPELGDIVHCNDGGIPCNSVWVVLSSRNGKGIAKVGLLYINDIRSLSSVNWEFGFTTSALTTSENSAWHISETQ